ncbi:MAG: RDD family protein [Arcicella sp.]|nr:RDD family protein [Arcicella sp.]
MPTIEELKQTYGNLSNGRLRKLITEKEQISVEAQEILDAEVLKRETEEGISLQPIEKKQDLSNGDTEINDVNKNKQKVTLLRCAARIVDAVLIYFLCVILVQFIYGVEIFEIAQKWAIFIFFFFYYPIFESQGGTLGKRFFNIQTVDFESQNSITLLQSYKRSLIQSCFLVVSIFVFLFCHFSSSCL